MKYLYTCITCLYVFCLTIAILFKRLLGDKENMQRLGFGLIGFNNSKPCYWLVASSMGEVNLAVKLIDKMKSVTDANLLLTVTTATGMKHALDSGSEVDSIYYHPFDLSVFVNRFLDKFHPTEIFLVETELWPTLMTRAFTKGISVSQVSGRISNKSFPGYMALKPLFAPLLRHCRMLLAQSRQDAARLRRLGAIPDKVEVMGSLKSDYQSPDPEKLHACKEYLEPWLSSPIIVCGSTRPGEEKTVLEAFITLRESNSSLRLVIAPRHLERIKEVIALVDDKNIQFVLRSNGVINDQDTVLLLDTMGELNLIYHLADIAFVGGTLEPFGGHNLLEPALAGCPVLYGPHFFAQEPGQELLQKQQMGFEVTNAQEFVKVVSSILKTDNYKELYTERAKLLRNANSDLIERCVTSMLNAGIDSSETG